MEEEGNGIPPQRAGGASDMKLWARQQLEAPRDRVHSRAMTLENGPNEGTAKHPFPVTDRQAYLDAVRGKGIAALTHKAPVGQVRLDKLNGIQQTVNRERLEQHLNNARMIPDGARGSGHGGLVDLPVIVRLGGQLIIHDGHHRLTAAKLRGDQTARVRYIDLDESGQKKEM